jgi:phage terminase small subunit
MKNGGIKMSRGGFRPGAGRPFGSLNGTGKPRRRIPKDIRDDAAKAGVSPLQFMLSVMNDPYEDDARRDRMAIAAAPFCHARADEVAGD